MLCNSGLVVSIVQDIKNRTWEFTADRQSSGPRKVWLLCVQQKFDRYGRGAVCGEPHKERMTWTLKQCAHGCERNMASSSEQVVSIVYQ